MDSKDLHERILRVVTDKPWLTHAEINERLSPSITNSTLSGAIRSLVRKGLLVARNDAGDYKYRYGPKQKPSVLEKARELNTKGIPWIKYPRTKTKALKMARLIRSIKANFGDLLDQEDETFISSLVDALTAMAERVLPDD